MEYRFKKGVGMRRAAFFVICCCLFSCRGFFADIQKANNSGGVSEITIPALGTSTSIEKCSIYALLCNEHVDLSVDLLKRMLIDGYTRTEHADFKNAHKLHSDKGIVEQLTYIDTPVSKPVSISFKNASQLKKYFIRILICQNGVIKYSGTTPENAIGQSAGKYFVTDNLFSPNDRDNEIGMTLHPIKLITYYVSNSGKVEADVCTFNEPTTLEKALKAIAALTESEKQGVSIVLLDNITTATSQENFATALQKAESIEISSIDTSVTPCKLALPNNFTIPANAKLFFNNVSLTGFSNITVNGDLALNEINLQANITSSNGVLTLNGTTLTGKITSTNGTVTLVNGATVKADATEGSGAIVGNDSVIAVNPSTQVEGTVTANGGVIQIGGNAKIGNKTSAIVLAANSEDPTKPYGHIEITSELTTEAIEVAERLQLPVTVDNSEQLFPYEKNPCFKNLGNISIDNFDLYFEIPVTLKYNHTGNGLCVEDALPESTYPTAIWLFSMFDVDDNPNDQSVKYFDDKTVVEHIKLGSNYRFSEVFSIDNDKLYFYEKKDKMIRGYNESDNSYTQICTLDVNRDFVDIFVDGNNVYSFFYNTKNHLDFSKFDLSTSKALSPTSLTGHGISSIKYDVPICATNNSVFFFTTTDSSIDVYHINASNITNTQDLVCTKKLTLQNYNCVPRDATIFNNAIYLLVGKCDGAYSRGGVIKINIQTNGDLTFDSIYGLTANNTPEAEEYKCFYHPVRFLGVHENSLIIADDGKTSKGIQKNRVVFFDTVSSGNKLQKIYRTNAEFLGVRK